MAPGLFRPFFGFLAIAAMLPAAGCGRGGPSLSTVRGEVTLDGRPIDRGDIMLEPMEGTRGGVTTAEISAGRYVLTGNRGAAVGLHRVKISSSGKTGRMIPNPFSPKGELMEEFAERVAPKFNSTTTLTFEVKPGDNTANFEVTSIRGDRR